MMKYLNFIFLSTFLFFIFSCDSGDIYPEENQNFTNVELNASFTFSGLNAFPESNYQIILGFFDDDATKPITSKVIQKPKNESSIAEINMTKIPTNAKYIRLVLSNSKTGTTIYSFFEEAITEKPSENITIPTQSINLLQYNRIQHEVFSQCIQCHGGGERAAAGLYLTEGNSYANLYEIQAVRSTKLRVKPYDANSSFIMDILKERELTGPHASIFTTLSSDDINLVEEWIKSGAEELVSY